MTVQGEGSPPSQNVAEAIDAERCPKKVGQNLRRQWLLGIFTDRPPQLQRFDQRLPTIRRGYPAGRCIEGDRGSESLCHTWF
jgi:hypothetical protein